MVSEGRREKSISVELRSEIEEVEERYRAERKSAEEGTKTIEELTVRVSDRGGGHRSEGRTRKNECRSSAPPKALPQVHDKDTPGRHQHPPHQQSTT